MSSSEFKIDNFKQKADNFKQKANDFKSKIMITSPEQNAIIAGLSNGNMSIDAIAGSGKTSTCLLVAKTYPNLKFLLLTYNAKLRLETKMKTNEQKITNMEVHTYHSFYNKYYNTCTNDILLDMIIESKTKVKSELFTYDVIIMDESQDLRPILYRSAKKIYKDNTVKNAKLCVIGDKNQNIYKYQEADYPHKQSLARFINDKLCDAMAIMLIHLIENKLMEIPK